MCVQLTAEFAQRLSGKISELLAVMENGLKSADPRDCTSYTGWTGEEEDPGMHFKQTSKYTLLYTLHNN